MARYAYERLSAESASFLMLERSTRLAHSAAAQIFDLGPLRAEHGGVDVAAIRRAVASRLHLAPRYRQKLRWIPFEKHPVWVDDAHFQLRYHVRHTAVPRPGGHEQIREQIGRIHAQRLDRSRPLWEMWVLEGLENDRFAILFKSHLSMAADGPDLLQLLLSGDRFEAYPEGPPFVPRPAPSARELVIDEVIRRARLPRQALERARAFTRETRGLGGELRSRLGAVAEMMGYSLRLHDDTPINGDLGPHRRGEAVVTPLEQAREVQRAFGTTINDVLVAVVSGALRRFMIDRLVHPASLDLRVSLPVSTRADGGAPMEIAEWLIDLPVWEGDATRRLELIAAQTRDLSTSKAALGARTLFSVARWTGSETLALAARRVGIDPRANLELTNVPGPQETMYLCGARLLWGFGLSPLAGGRSLGITVFSYDGALCWGLNADYDRVPDLERLGEHIRAAFDELLAAARAAPGDRPHLEVVS